jgi:hypothetical protein
MAKEWWGDKLSKREVRKRIMAVADIRDVVRDWADGTNNNPQEDMAEIYDYMCEHGLMRKPK